MTRPRHIIHQTSVMAALLDGVFDGETDVTALLDRGDFGLGTFDALDGEMVILDGTCHRLTADGAAHPVDGSARTPFAVVTRFVTHARAALTSPHDRAEVRAVIDGILPSANYMYAVRVDGRFSSMRVRAVHAQEHPYPRLTDVTDDQATRVLADVEGTVVGFRTPAFEHGISVPGYHAHFVSADRSSGGHILDYTLEAGEVRLCVGTDLHLELPRTELFATADLDADDLDAQVDRAES